MLTLNLITIFISKEILVEVMVFGLIARTFGISKIVRLRILIQVLWQLNLQED